MDVDVVVVADEGVAVAVVVDGVAVIVVVNGIVALPVVVSSATIVVNGMGEDVL